MADEDLRLDQIPALSREVFANQVEEEGGRRPPVSLEQITPELEDTIRTIVALRFAGCSEEEVSDKIGVDVGYGRSLEAKYPAHFLRAKKKQVDNLQEEVKMNLVAIHAGLTQYSFPAMRVLYDLAMDPEVSAGIRARAAKDLLSLAGAGYSGKNDRVNQAVQVVLNNVPDVDVGQERIITLERDEDE